MSTPTPNEVLTAESVKARFGLDPDATGNRPRSWRIVDEGESNDLRAFNGTDIPAGSLAVHTRDGASNPICPEACKLPNFIGSVQDDYDSTYRDYFYAPLNAPASQPITEGEEAELKRMAEAATPGPWSVGDGSFSDHVFGPDGFEVSNTPLSSAIHRDYYEGRLPDGHWATTPGAHRDVADGEGESNAAYIAAANPAMILALIGKLEAQSAELSRLRECVRKDEAVLEPVSRITVEGRDHAQFAVDFPDFAKLVEDARARLEDRRA